jgi:hypothetical protein
MLMHRLDNPLKDSLVNNVRDNRSRTIGTHSTCVWAKVTVVRTLVVLTWGQRSVGCTVHDDEHAGFFPRKEGLKQYKSVAFYRGGDESMGLLSILGDHDAFSAGQNVSLDDPRLAIVGIEGRINI